MRVFTPDEREIFQFKWPDGTEGRADPLRIRRRLVQATAGKLDDYYDAALEPYETERVVVDEHGVEQTETVLSADAHRIIFAMSDAQEKLIAATAHAFEVQGATEQWLWDTCLAFDQWIQKKSWSGPTPST